MKYPTPPNGRMKWLLADGSEVNHSDIDKAVLRSSDEIVEDLGAALQQFAAIAADLKR